MAASVTVITVGAPLQASASAAASPVRSDTSVTIEMPSHDGATSDPAASSSDGKLGESVMGAPSSSADESAEPAESIVGIAGDRDGSEGEQSEAGDEGGDQDEGADVSDGDVPAGDEEVVDEEPGGQAEESHGQGEGERCKRATNSMGPAMAAVMEAGTAMT